MTGPPPMAPAEDWAAPVGLARRLRGLSDGIASYLHGVLLSHGKLPARSFYGESFSALLLGQPGSPYASLVPRLFDLYREKDKEDPSFHWEFNKYAWCSLYRTTGDQAVKELALPLRFRGTPVTNWALLRSCTRHLAGIETAEASRAAADVLRRCQSRSGLICDQPNVRSFQYHCFSAVLVAEIHALGGEPFFLDRFRHAANFIEPFVLRTGDTLYVGRGQEQSFGYGALACLLAIAYRQFGTPRHLSALARCVAYLEGHRRSDGSFPLVLNEVEEGYPPSEAAGDPRFPGWYAYNNYFDYLPFLGVFLGKAADVLDGAPPREQAPPPAGYRDRDFLVSRTRSYEAVVSRPGGGWGGGGGYWTNDLPFPYVVWNGKRVTPSYGGEQFGSTLYSSAGIPLPAIERRGRRRLLRDGRLWSLFLGNCLVVLTLRGLLVRRFRFADDGIVVQDLMLGAGKPFARYLFDQVLRRDERTFVVRGGAVVEFSVPMEIQPTREYYWGGPLQVLVAREPSARCTVRLRLGVLP